jgi:hemolysin activation/secretion protein
VVAALVTAASLAAVQQVQAAAQSSTDTNAAAPETATESGATASSTAGQPPARPTTPDHFDIDGFRVDGADALPQIEVEEAVYPFLGPRRTPADVEKARAALEKSYHDKGYQTVSVATPPQNVDSRIIVLKVTEGKVGVLRVKNSRYFDLAKIKEKAPSLKEGTLPNFKNVTTDIVALNQWSDRRVTPALRAGVTPGTVDVDLNVEDKAPIHASAEVNNRKSPNTTDTRFNATVHYDNLWQLGHSLSMSYQIAPQRPDDAEVFSGSYLARLTDSISILTYGLTSASDVATVGGLNVVGPGQTIGTRAVVTLPAADSFFHTLSFGFDYKHYGQTVQIGAAAFSTPVTYYPVAANYSATWQHERALTQLNSAVTFNIRGVGSGFDEFDAKRYGANSSFFHLNADLSHTQDLGAGYQLFAKMQGQVADGPLVSSEQFSLGGLDTVRGYLESEVLGDNGVAGTAEFRSPDIGAWLQGNVKDETGQGTPRYVTFNEWRTFAFGDIGYANIYQPLIGQQSNFNLASYGFGARFKTFNVFNGMVAVAMPVMRQTYTRANDPRVIFRVWGEF